MRCSVWVSSAWASVQSAARAWPAGGINAPRPGLGVERLEGEDTTTTTFSFSIQSEAEIEMALRN